MIPMPKDTLWFLKKILGSLRACQALICLPQQCHRIVNRVNHLIIPLVGHLLVNDGQGLVIGSHDADDVRRCLRQPSHVWVSDALAAARSGVAALQVLGKG